MPDPAVDVDACFRFVVDLSRKLGQVQFFSASRILHHHAWVRVEGGRVVRAYAWAGETLWSQGLRTPAEKELGMSLTPAFQLVPEQSTAAIVIHHPQAKYYSTGESRVDQLTR